MPFGYKKMEKLLENLKKKNTTKYSLNKILTKKALKQLRKFQILIFMLKNNLIILYQNKISIYFKKLVLKKWTRNI